MNNGNNNGGNGDNNGDSDFNACNGCTTYTLNNNNNNNNNNGGAGDDGSSDDTCTYSAGTGKSIHFDEGPGTGNKLQIHSLFQYH